MIRGIAVLLTVLSVLLFPWQLSALFALAIALFEPFLPLAAGLFIDTLYFAPHAFALPIATALGAFVTGIALFVRTRLNADPVRDW